MAERAGCWTDVCVKDLFRARFYYREIVESGRTNAANHFVNLILPILKRSDPVLTSTSTACARLLRLFIMEMERVFPNVSSENGQLGESGWIMKLRRTPGYHMTNHLMNAAKDPCTESVPTQYGDIRIRPIMYAEFVRRHDVVWTSDVDRIVHASVRRALGKVSRMYQEQHAVADNWLRISGLGSDSALAKYRATCRGLAKGFQVYGRAGPRHPSEKYLKEWEAIAQNLACVGEIPTFCSMAGSVTLEANRGRRTMTKDSGPVEIDRIIYLNRMELYMEKEHLVDVEACSKAVLKFMVEDYDGKEMFFGLEHTSDGRRLDYRCILKLASVGDSTRMKLIKAMAERMRSQFYPAHIFYFSSRTIIVAQVNEIRLAVWKLLQGVPECRQPQFPKTAVVTCLFWLDNKGVKGRLAMRLIESGQELLFEKGVSAPISVISYLGSEKDIQGFKGVWTLLMNEVASNCIYKFDQGGYVYVRLGLVVADHLACWNMLGIPQKPSSYSDCFGLTDLSCSFVLHQAKSHFCIGAAVAGRRAYMAKDPDAEEEIHVSDEGSDVEEEDKASDCREWSDDSEEIDCVENHATILQGMTPKQIYRMPDLSPAKIVARANYLKYFKWDPIMSTGAMFNLRSFMVIPPGLHNVVSSLCSVCCTRVPKLLPRGHPAMKDIIRQYELISGTENSSSIVANGRMYRSLTHKIATLLVPAISKDGILRSLARQDDFPNITICLPFWAHLATVSDILVQEYYSHSYRTAARRGIFRALSFMHFYIRALEELYRWNIEVESWTRLARVDVAVGEDREPAAPVHRKRPNGGGSSNKKHASRYPKQPLFSVYDIDVELHMPDIDELLRIPLCRLLEEKFEQQFIVEDLIKWQKRTGTAIVVADKKRFIDDIVNDVLSYSGHGELQKDSRSSIREFRPWFVAACVFLPDMWAAPGCPLSNYFARCNMRNFYRRVLSLHSLKDAVLIEVNLLPGIPQTRRETLSLWKRAREIAHSPVERLAWLLKAIIDAPNQPFFLPNAYVIFLGEGSSSYHPANPLLEERPEEVVITNSLDSEVVGVLPASQDVIDAVRNVVPCCDCNPAKGKPCSHKSRRLFGLNNIPFQIAVAVDAMVRVRKREAFVYSMYHSPLCYDKYVLPTLEVQIKRCEQRLRPDLGNKLKERRDDPSAVRATVLRSFNGNRTDRPVYDSVDDEWLPDYLFCVEPSHL